MIEQRSYPVPQGFLDWQLTEQGPKEEIAFLDCDGWSGLLFGAVTMWRRHFGKSKIGTYIAISVYAESICFVVSLFAVDGGAAHSILYAHGTRYSSCFWCWNGFVFATVQKLLKYWHRTPQMVRVGTWFVCAIGLIMMVHFSEQSPLYARADWRYEWRLNALDWSRINHSKSSSTSLKAYEQTCADRLQNESMMPSIYP